MKPKVKTALWVFLLFTCLAWKAFPQQFIKTSTAGGFFTSDQSMVFELSRPGSLRLFVDGREIYRGEGPAFPELGVPQGEERGFTLAAEYYTPEQTLLESRSWYIYIDKKAPLVPDLEFRRSGGGFRLTGAGVDRNTRVRVLAEIDSEPVFFPDPAEAELALPESFGALVWAEDLAGNVSGVQSRYFELPPVKIESPAPGEWLNPQTLIISGTGGKDIYWTVDGSDPLEAGGTGRLYRGPERIGKDGPVTLRTAWRDSAGLPRGDSVSYTVRVPPPDGSIGNWQTAFARTEESPVGTPVQLAVPGSFLWSAGGIPYLEGGGAITLRPEVSIRRTAVFHLSGGEPGSGVYRYAFLLDGTGGGEGQVPAGSAPSAAPLKETPLVPGGEGRASAVPPPVLVSARRGRLVLWPQAEDGFFFSWEGGPWRKAGAPFPVPREGGTLRWFTPVDNSVSGPHGVALPALPRRDSGIRGRTACRVYGGDSGWDYVSEPAAYVPGIVKNRRFDVCDGEDLEWAFISAGGEVLERNRRDRLAPPAPRIAAPDGGSWNRGPVSVSLLSGGEDGTFFINARLRYASGAVELLTGTGKLDIASSLGEEAEVSVESFIVDASGNRGPAVLRNFTLDPVTVYVAPEPLAARGGPARAGGVPDKGGMDNPFTSLEEAFAYAMGQDRGDIRVSGKLELRNPITVSRKIRVDGNWKGDGMASLISGDRFSWTIGPGAGLCLSGIRLERASGNSPLILAGKGSVLEIAGSDLSHSGPLLSIDGGSCVIKDTLVNARLSGERRVAVLSATGSTVQVKDSRIQLEADNALLLDISGGSLSAENSTLLSAGRETASVLALGGARGELAGLILSSAARDYASVLEASGSGIVLSGGTLGVSARDAAAVLLDKSSAAVSGAVFQVEAAFTARALEIRGAFPWIQDCGFYFEGSAKNPEVFSGAEAAAPLAGSVTGNRFLGFAGIWGADWPLDKLQGFNRAFAQPDKPNSAIRTRSAATPAGVLPGRRP